MRCLSVFLALLFASPAAAQTFGSIEEHGRLLLYGNPGTGYAEGLTVLYEEIPATGPGDLLTAAAFEEIDGRISAGALYRYAVPAARAPGEPLGTFLAAGPDASSRLGRAFGTGDFNADGLTDIVVTGNTRGLVDYGTVWVLWGSDDGIQSQVVLAQDDLVGGQLGASVSVGDLNDDGIDDFVVGDPRAAWGLFSEESRVLFFYGDSALGPGAGNPSWDSFSFSDAAGLLGSSVSVDVDWNCDGLPDLLSSGVSGRLFLMLNPGTDVVEPGWFPNGGGFQGSPNFWIEIEGELGSPALKPIQTADLTGDGCADVLLGLPRSLESRGELALIDGRSTPEWGPAESVKAVEDIAWMRRRGALPAGLAGWAVQPVEWFSGPDSTKPDLIVTAPSAVSAAMDFEATGRALVIPGAVIFGEGVDPVQADPPGSTPTDHPRLEDMAMFVMEGNTFDLRLGTGLALWEDVDGDFLRDVAVTAPGFRLDPEGELSTEGAIYLVESSDFVEADGDGAAPFEDCDDLDPSIFPGAEESCDGVDNDCNGVADFGDPGEETEADGDGDGVRLCEGDCDDTVATTSPDALELCNGVDDDCDGLSDEDWDADGDGYPAAGEPCEEVEEAGGADCDDQEPSIHPGAGDGPGFADTNCDGDGEWGGGCACAVPGSVRSEGVLGAAVLLGIVSLARRKRRSRG